MSEQGAAVTDRPRLRITSRYWERLQHYRDRRPPWIKLHVELLDDYEFTRLRDASKLLAVGCMLLAADTDNHIPDDPQWVGHKLHLETVPDLGALVRTGFLEVCGCPECPASTTLAPRLQFGVPEAEAEGEREAEGETDVSPARSATAETSETDDKDVVVWIPIKGRVTTTTTRLGPIRNGGDGYEAGVTGNHLEEWRERYPGVDVEQTLRRIEGWNRANPRRRKTPRGIAQHVEGWLAREQDSGSRANGRPGSRGPVSTPQAKVPPEHDYGIFDPPPDGEEAG